MTIETKKWLLDALSACRKIGDFTSGLNLPDYEQNLIVQSAVERQLEIVGEALNRAVREDAQLDQSVPELRSAIGLRNRLIHGYDTVDQHIVWDIVERKVPPLEARIADLLQNEAYDP